MKYNFIMVFLGLAMCLLTMVSAAPTGEGPPSASYNVTIDLKDPKYAELLGYDPSYYYQGYATVEIWVGQTPVNVGNVYGGELYRVASRVIEHECASHDGWCYQTNWRLSKFNTRYAQPNDDNLYEGETGFKIEQGNWETPQSRKLLIGILSGAMEATTNNPANCYHVRGVKLCNIGDIYRVNMPKTNGYKNDLHLRVVGDGIGRYTHAYRGIHDCCGTRSWIDPSIDGTKDEVNQIWHQYSRDVRCIIDGWTVCP
ncbi:hypothetical protein IQ07DRAFT_682133 [Pyrenochaeta sp. DS3sAY3a]|nr:hypothetical protein IQ07DRAFT_682133 [Pyrenochaeta sp. DS3sAY3a]